MLLLESIYKIVRFLLLVFAFQHIIILQMSHVHVKGREKLLN